ncbi:ZBED8 protein, partial [Polyodon spathula]|nr:ZBED8 protein [Polyodon spathula]
MDQFAFVEKTGSTVCLICNERIASLKKSNVKRHFDTRHTVFVAKYPNGDCRKKACAENHLQMGSILRATCSVWLKNRLTTSQTMPLSARTVHERALIMVHQIAETQINDINSGSSFSLSLDESTNVSNVAQLSIVGRYVMDDTVREYSLSVLPMKDTTRGQDVLKSLMDFVTEKTLPLDKLISICTDGAPSMLGKRKGFVAILCEQEKQPILNFHCIVHQEALYGEELHEVM